MVAIDFPIAWEKYNGSQWLLSPACKCELSLKIELIVHNIYIYIFLSLETCHTAPGLDKGW